MSKRSRSIGKVVQNNKIVHERELRWEQAWALKACGPVELDAENDEMSLFERLCCPLSDTEFYQQIYKRKVLVTHVDKAKRVEELKSRWLLGLDVKELIDASPSEKIFAWLPGKNKVNGGKIASIELENPKDAWSAFSSGASLYFRAPEQFTDVWVPALSESIGFGFAARYNDGNERSEVETFIGYPGNVTDWHFDFMENFTIQLAGTKKWSFHRSQGVVHNPIRGSTPHYRMDDNTIEQQNKVHRLAQPLFVENHAFPNQDREVYTVTLRPGSVMYFPAGMWHKVETVGEDVSISINFSLMPLPWSDFIADALRGLMWNDEEFRACMMLSDRYYLGDQSRRDARGCGAREHLDKLLNKLKDTFSSKLNAEMMLPSALLRPLPGPPVEDEEEEDDDDDENEKQQQKQQQQQQQQRVSIDKKMDVYRTNPLAVLVPLSMEDGEVTYALHVHFGNEEISSALRVELTFPMDFEPVMVWICGQRKEGDFSFHDLPRPFQSKKDIDTMIFEPLVRNGYLTIVK